METEKLLDNLKITVESWFNNAEKIAVTLSEKGYEEEARTFEGQATAYWTVKTYLEVNGL